MKRKILDFSIMKEEISQNNVLEMAELIAFMELRFQIGYQGSRMQRMYADLYADIKHKNELGHTFSDSYDLVQEGALFLCEHYGEHLNDVISYSKKGKPITIKIACIRKMMKLINRKTSEYYRSVSLDALTAVGFFPNVKFLNKLLHHLFLSVLRFSQELFWYNLSFQKWFLLSICR